MSEQNALAEEVPRKWCQLCEKWVPAFVVTSDVPDATVPMSTKREVIYCPNCGARLRPKPGAPPVE